MPVSAFPTPSDPPKKAGWPITQPVVLALGRHVVSFAAGAVVAATGAVAIISNLHVASADQATSLTTAIHDVGSAIGTIVSGVTTLTGALASGASVLMAIFAAMSSRTSAQAEAVVDAVPGTQIVTSTEIANATKSPDIVSHEEAVVTKP